MKEQAVQQRTARSSAIQVVTLPLVPKTPDKGSNPVLDVPVALLSPFSGKTVSSSTNLIITSPLAPMILDMRSNPVAPLTPGTDKTSQNCHLHEITKLPGERLADENIQENCMTRKVPFQHAKSSFEGVSPRCLESTRDEGDNDETRGIDLNKTPRKKTETRKKHRPKVIQEGKPIKSPSPETPKVAENKVRLIPKRTYARKKKSSNSAGSSICITEENKVQLIPMKTYVRKRKALNSSESLSGRLGETMGLCSSTAVKSVNQLDINASKSVRRHLDFSGEGETVDGCHLSAVSDVKVADGETYNSSTPVGSREFSQGLNAVMTKFPPEITFDLNRSSNHVLDENPTPSAQRSGTEVVRKLEGGSDSNIVENDIIMQSDQELFESGSHSDIVTSDDAKKTGTNRAHDQIDKYYAAKESPRGIHFVHGYNGTSKTSLCQETSSLLLYLPVVYKRRRTKRGQTWRCNRAYLLKLSRCFTIADSQWSATFNRLQQSELILAFHLTHRVTRKRSKLHTRARKPTPISGAEDCSHLLWSPEKMEGSHVASENNKYEPQTCMDALFADTRFKVTTKKRRKNGHVRLISSIFDMEQECEVASSRFGFLGQPFVPQAVVPYIDPTEVLLDLMKHMKIEGEHIKATAEASNGLIPYGRTFDTIKKQLPRAKVDLDSETNRLWNLLMGGKSDGKANGVDMDKEKWWEEERHVFRGRTDAFVARMHLIQGDRRFSKWNGSIVDSVVGAFLTQNVSDHLSSSAFMSLAARFPIKSRGNNMEANVEKMVPSKEQRDGSIPASGETITCQVRSVPEMIAPGSTEAYKKEEEEEASVVSSFLKSISYEPSLIYDEQLPKKEDNFSAENTHEEVEILTETEHCGKQTEYRSSCVGFKFNVKNEIESSKNEQPQRKRGVSRENKVNSETKRMFNWEGLHEEAFANGAKNERDSDTVDSLDWEQVRNTDVNEISKTIRERGMNNVLAQRIKDFLDRIVKDHGSIDLEWLRNVPPDKAKEYLLSIRGLGLKSVECVRLLTLHHRAFPVDTNVGRVSVRLGWVPLQPLPESLQLHLLELYPMIEHIQKYLWPRLCTLDQQTLYELHYQMITFGKVFCTKTKPNCNACPMRGECKHFASAFASARLSLPAPEASRLVASRTSSTFEKERSRDIMSISLSQLEGRQLTNGSISNDCEPIIEEPATPGQEYTQTLERDIEDAFYEDTEEIPTIKLNSEVFVKNLENYMQENQVEMQDGVISNALVTTSADTASLPTPKLKNVNRLRTEHQVYELPDLHPLLEGMDQRVPGDPCPYLLAIWTAGETSRSIEPPQSCHRPQDSAILCDGKTCFACNSAREAQARTVRGTILIPCRTAMRGSFPLNGTYFQVNEVFADHSSSHVPIDVPRDWIWNLPRRTVFFGTSVSTIFRGLTMEDIQQCFWRGFVCVRGFDRESRVPRPLYARLHFPPSKAVQNKKMPAKEE